MPSKHHILYFRVGELPEVREMASLGLAEMQELVEGPIEMLCLDPDTYMWLNEEGRLRKLPLNRRVPVGSGHTDIVGHFFLTSLDAEGDTQGLTLAQFSKWLREASAWPSLSTTRLTRERLAGIRGRADAATPGRWFLGEDPDANSPGGTAVLAEDVGDDPWRIASVDVYSPGDDGPFLAHARLDIPALVAEIDALHRDLKREMEAAYWAGAGDMHTLGARHDPEGYVEARLLALRGGTHGNV